jgi:hypothetical protein
MKKKPQPKISLFASSKAKTPTEQITLDTFFERVKDGYWKKLVDKLRSIHDLSQYKKVKESLPGLTISGNFNSRDKFIDLKKRLKNHTGYICLDIDAKDNPKIRIQDLIDKDCLMQFVSCSGKGIKIIYRCTATKDAAVHRRIYDAAIKRLEDKGIMLKVDPIVKSIGSLQFVTYDNNAFYFPSSKLIIKPLPAVKIKKVKPSEDQAKDIEQLNEFIEALGDRDITKKYEDWLTIGMGLTYSLGESGRVLFHNLSKNYPEYSKDEVDEKYDSLLERDPNHIDRPVTLASIYQILYKSLPKAAVKRLAKKYNTTHVIGVGEEETTNSELSGFVKYKMFLFKQIREKKTNELLDLKLQELNLNEFEKLLRRKGFMRHDDLYVHIQDNIVEKVDEHDILRICTAHIENEGDYMFTYANQEWKFSWEEIAHEWRKIRGNSNTFNQIATCLEHWQPKLLRDGMHISYIPYKNGVVEINAQGKRLLPYSSITSQIWKDQILPREFKYTQEVGMFEEFFANVCGRGGNRKEIIKSERYKRSLWYFGYALHGFKLKSLARAWMIYDIKPGNNGRTGKSILGQAIGYIRNMVTIDGKTLDTTNRFAFQKIRPSTQVVFIDDPKKYMSLAPLFNMITGDTDAEAKGQDVISSPLKYIFASNWLLELEGNSERGRQFITQIDDYYVRYAKENDGTLRPIVHKHKKEFFTEWDDSDWSKFDSFCVRCIQTHLSKETPQDTIIGNATQLRFIQQHEPELFYKLSQAFIGNVRKGKDGSLLISQPVLINVIKDSPEFMTNQNRAGRVVREYLFAISGEEPQVTSIVLPNMIQQMAYRISKSFDQLGLDDAVKMFGKPKI